MNFSRPVHPAAYALVTATPVPLPTARTARSRVHAPPPQRCLTRLRPDESALPAVFRRTAVQPDTTSGSYNAATGDHASISGAAGPPGAEIERGSTSCPGRALRTAEGEVLRSGRRRFVVVLAAGLLDIIISIFGRGRRPP